MPASSAKSDFLDIRTRILISTVVSTAAIYLSDTRLLVALALATFAYVAATGRWKVVIAAYAGVALMSLLSVGIIYGLFGCAAWCAAGTPAAAPLQALRATMTANFHTPFLRMIPSLNVILALTLNFSVHGFTGAMKSWRFPRALYLPLMVFCRFVPEFIEVVARLRDAVRMRGFSLSFGSALVHPLRTLRLSFIPLSVKTLRMADNLAIAAEMKRVGYAKKPTVLNPLEMRVHDYAALAVAVLLSGTLCFWQLTHPAPAHSMSGGMRGGAPSGEASK